MAAHLYSYLYILYILQRLKEKLQAKDYYFGQGTPAYILGGKLAD